MAFRADAISESAQSSPEQAHSAILLSQSSALHCYIQFWQQGGMQAQGYCLQVEDPWTSDFLKYQDMGFSREEVGMALGALGPDADQESQVRRSEGASLGP
jgi:hypothetical protein